MDIENTDAQLNDIFHALSDPTRRSILARLIEGQATVTELAEPFTLSQPAISKHLKVLENAGLIEEGRDAQKRPRRLNSAALKEVADWIEPFRLQWAKRFDNLEAHMGRHHNKE